MMGERKRFMTAFGRAGEAAGPGAAHAPQAIATAQQGGLIDAALGLVFRFALAVQFAGWARVNARQDVSALDWRGWIEPSPGLLEAASVWTLGRADPAILAQGLLIFASASALALAIGFLTRPGGLLVSVAALWHAAVILPEAWPSTIAYAALGTYLLLRGAGAASLDWILMRLTRFG